jgi:hypothetical protein
MWIGRALAAGLLMAFAAAGGSAHASELGGHAGALINAATWAPSTPGAYFFDRSSPESPAEYSRREAEFGRKFDGHLYYLPLDVTPGDLVNAHWSLAVDRVPFVILSWATGNNPITIIPGIATGRYDTDIVNFAKAVKSELSPYGHILIRPFWEFNYTGSEWNDVHYGDNPAEFIRAWRHVVDIFRSNGVGNVKWVWNPIRVASNQAQNPVSYYPGSGYVDWIGIDAYPKHTWLTLQQLATTSSGGSSFDWYDTFKSYGKPLMFGEVGILPANVYGVGAPSRATWWHDALSELENNLPAVKAIEYFDSSAGYDWRYDAPGTLAGDSGRAALTAARDVALNCYLDVLSKACSGRRLSHSRREPSRHTTQRHRHVPRRVPHRRHAQRADSGRSPTISPSQVASRSPADHLSPLSIGLIATGLALAITGIVFGYKKISTR